MGEIDFIVGIGADRAADVGDLFGSTWWAADRTDDDAALLVARSTLAVGLVDRQADRLVAFARVLSDGLALATVLDVIVHPDWRGRGLGARLMEELLSQPLLCEVRSVELVCQPDLVAFYERWGFTDRVGGSRLMRRTSDPRLGNRHDVGPRRGSG